MTKTYEKQEIIFSEQAKKAWDIQYQNLLKRLPVLFPDIKPEQLPEPKFQSNEDGSGKLFMIVGRARIEQAVAKGQWEKMHKKDSN